MEKEVVVNRSGESLTQAPPVRHPGSNSTITRGIAVAVAIVLVGGGGFFAGMQYANASGTTSGVGGAGGAGANGGFGSRMGQRGGFGTVTAVSSSSITISEMQVGPNQSTNSASSTTSKTYAVTSSTTVTDNGSTASIGDINTGDTVMVQTSTSDTSTATSIALNPTMGGPVGQTQSTGSTDTSTSTSST